MDIGDQRNRAPHNTRDKTPPRNGVPSWLLSRMGAKRKRLKKGIPTHPEREISPRKDLGENIPQAAAFLHFIPPHFPLVSKNVCCVTYGENNVMSAQMLGVSPLGVGSALRLERSTWSLVKITKASNRNEYATPPPAVRGTLGNMRVVKKRDRNESVFARPNGLRENSGKKRDFGYGAWTCQKEENGIPVVGSMKRRKMRRCALVAKK